MKFTPWWRRVGAVLVVVWAAYVTFVGPVNLRPANAARVNFNTNTYGDALVGTCTWIPPGGDRWKRVAANTWVSGTGTTIYQDGYYTKVTSSDSTAYGGNQPGDAAGDKTDMTGFTACSNGGVVIGVRLRELGYASADRIGVDVLCCKVRQ